MFVNRIAVIQTAYVIKDTRIVAKKVEIEEAYHRYDAQGGTALEKRDEINRKKAEIQADYSKNEESLFAMSASILPLTLVSDLIYDIKLTAQDEHNEHVLQQALDQIGELLEQFSAISRAPIDGGRDFYAFIKERVESFDEQSVYGLSDHALFQVSEIVETQLQSAREAVKTALSAKKVLKEKLVETESLLQLDINEKKLKEAREEIRSLEDERFRLEVELRTIQNERSTINAAVITKTAEFNRCVEAYLRETELTDDSDRTERYSNLAIQIIDKYASALQARKAGLLAQTVTDCYKQLANKSNLIDRVQINSDTLEISYFDSNEKEVEKASFLPS